MKIKLQTIYPRQTYEVDNLYISSDLHLNHESILKFGRKFRNIEEMNQHILDKINFRVKPNDMLILLGDTLFGEKDYLKFLESLNCNNIILLYGNHCSRSKLSNVKNNKLLYVGDYLEFSVGKQIVCCSHYAQFHWNYMSDGSISLHGHNHAFEDNVLKQIHEYKSMDTGIDNYYELFGEYNVFEFNKIVELLQDKKTINRH